MSEKAVRWLWRGIVWFTIGALISVQAARLYVHHHRAVSSVRLSAAPAGAEVGTVGPPGTYAPGAVIVRYANGRLGIECAARDLGPGVTGEINKDTQDVTLHFNPRIPVAKAIETIRAEPGTLWVEPDGISHALYTPNDPYLDQKYDSSDGPLNQWYLKTIHAPEAWEVSRAVRSEVRLAIIDTGIDYKHPDLKGIMAHDSKGELIGRSFVPGVSDPLDDHGHGTHCAGIAAAETDNGVGVAGVGFKSFRLVPAKVLSEQGGGNWDWIANAITWCADNGCRVESMSLGSNQYSQGIQDAINYAWKKGVIVVAAAGNSSSALPGYPAGCNHVVAVSATDPADKLASFSNYGTPIAVGAPGVKLLATLPTYPCAITRGGRRKVNYDSLSGTSMACPVAAGALAHLLAYQPTLTAEQAIQRLETTADNTGNAPNGGWETQFGNGRVNLANAILNKPRKATVGSIYGQAVDRNGESISNASVRCGNVSVRTRVDGMFRFSNLKPGAYSVSATAAGSTGAGTATVAAGCDAPLTITVGGG
jgi:thermitase